MDFGNPFGSVDLLPPVLNTARQTDSRTIMLVFDEPVVCGPAAPLIEPALAVDGSDATGNTLTIHLGEDQEIGKPYVLRFCAEDEAGNSLSGLYRFSGWNPRIPPILINEFNPRGSSSTPDCVELLSLEAGNIGGLRLLIGTEGRFKDEIVFPAVEIGADEYIVIHTKPEGLDEEIDETGAMDESGGRLARPDARDFWMRDAPGLPGNNGALTLLNRRGGDILDAVLYSDREDDPDDERFGWTADGFALAEELSIAQAWLGENGNTAYPSDAVNAGISSATRSICRSPLTPIIDTNSKQDWHIVPTRGASFGEENMSEIYEP